jgi:hypothetical protein
MSHDYTAAVALDFAEDLTYAEVAPVLDALAATAIFRVRASRVAWSGPAGGGPEVGLILTAIASGGAAVFAATFCSELAKDAYKGARAAVLAVVRSLRDRQPEDRRAVVGFSIRILTIEICVGPLLDDEPGPDDWTDEWLVERLLKAQAIVDQGGERRSDPGVGCDHWVK